MTEKNDKTGAEQEESIVEISLAEQLITARERSGYTVDRAAAATRITGEFIVCLESGKYQKLPNLVFVRGFIKSLAKLYNTPHEPLLLSLEREIGDKKPAPAAVAPVSSRESQKATLVPPLDRGRKAKFEAPKVSEFSALSRGKKISIGIAAALAIVLVVVAQLPKHSDISPKQVTETVKQISVPAPITASNPLEEGSEVAALDSAATETTATSDLKSADGISGQTSTAAVEPGSPAETTVTAPPAISGLQELRVVANSPVRLRYKKDAEQWVAQDLKAETYTYQFKDGMQVMVYDAGAVEVFFNGKSLGNLGNKGRIRRLNFQTADLSKATAKKP